MPFMLLNANDGGAWASPDLNLVLYNMSIILKGFWGTLRIFKT